MLTIILRCLKILAILLTSLMGQKEHARIINGPSTMSNGPKQFELKPSTSLVEQHAQCGQFTAKSPLTLVASRL